MKLQKLLGFNKRESAKKPTPLFKSKKAKKSKKQKNVRARHYSIWLTSKSRFIITTRRFKTSKTKRSKRYKQFVVRVLLLPIKEISIRFKHLRRKPKVSFRLKLIKTMSILLIGIGLGGAVTFTLNLEEPLEPQPISQISLPAPETIKNETTKVGLKKSKPIHINIPSVDISAKIGSVGLKSDKTMEVPDSPTLTAWYKHSPTPGEIGPSVIVGHVDYINYGPAVFWRLSQLKPGDKIVIKRADGSKVTFKVTSLKSFDQDSFPTKKVYGNINYAGLRLITCGGTLDRSSGHYSNNTVVFASLVSS